MEALLTDRALQVYLDAFIEASKAARTRAEHIEDVLRLYDWVPLTEQANDRPAFELARDAVTDAADDLATVLRRLEQTKQIGEAGRLFVPATAREGIEHLEMHLDLLRARYRLALLLILAGPA